MGLLDQLFGNADQTQALGLLGAQMMAGNTPAGFQAATTLLAEAPDRKMKRDLGLLQLENMRSEIDQRKVAMAKQQQIQDMMSGLFGGGGGSAQQMSPGAFAPSADGMGPTLQPSMAAQAQPGSRLASMGIDQIAGLHAAGGPNLMDAYKWAHDPLKMEQGSTYRDRITGQERFMPKVEPGIAPDQYGFYNDLPGYGKASASIKGAEAAAQESAKAAQDLVQVAQPDGSTRFVTRASVVGGQPQRQPLPSMPPASSQRITPEVQRASDEDSIRILQSEINTEKDPNTRAGLQRELDRMTTAQKRPGFPTASMIPAQQLAQADSTQATPSTAQRATAKAQEAYGSEVGKDMADTRKNIMAAGISAPSNIAKYQQLGRLLEGVDGGSLTATGTNIASAANSLGLKIDKNLPNKEAAAALGNEMALQLRSPAGGAGMPGAMSDKDREFLVGMIPNAGQTLQGRKLLIDAQIAISQRSQQVATFARNYEKKYGQLDNGFFEQMQAWSNANPLFGGK